MRKSRVPCRYLVGLVTLLVMAVACGGEAPPQLDCGEGTTLQNTECVPQESAECEEDEVLTPDGECGDPEEFACEEGTTYDEGLGECISEADVECGPETVEVDGECVLEDPLVCGDGTVLYEGECRLADEVCGDDTDLDDQELECRPGVGACGGGTQYDFGTGECVNFNLVEDCGEGTHELNDECLPLDSFADQLAEDADVEYGSDTPIIPSDDTFVFKGTLEDELTHVYDLSGTEGQWLEIALYSRGMPSPGFMLDKPDSVDWSREVSAGMVSAPKRTMLVPATEQYELTVESAMSEYEDWDGEGHEDWKYVGTVEVLDNPDPTDWEAFEQQHDGQLDDVTANFLEIDVEQEYEVVITVDDVGDGARDGMLELWNGPEDYGERFELEAGQEYHFDTIDRSTLYFYVDAVEFEGVDLSYGLRAQALEHLAPGDSVEATITAQEGEVLFVSHESDQAGRVDVDVRLDGDQKYYFSGVNAANQSSYDEDETRREFFYVQETGAYTVHFRNNSLQDLTGFLGQVYTEDDIPVFEVPDDGESHEFVADLDDDQGLNAGDWRFVVVDTPERALFDVTIEAGSGTPRGSIYTGNPRERIANESGSSGTTTVDFQAAEPGVYYAVARPYLSYSTVDDLEFEITGQTVDSLDIDDTYTETFDGDGFDVLEMDVYWAFGDEAEIRLFNENGDLLVDDVVDEAGTQMRLLPGTGEYTVELENTGEEPLVGYDIDYDFHTPFETAFIGEDFSETYQQTAQDAGEREFFVIQSSPGIGVTSTFDMLDSSDDIEVRFWDFEDGGIVGEGSGSGEVVVANILEGSEGHAIEIRSDDDMDDGYDLSLEAGEASSASRSLVLDPIEIIDPGTTGFYTFDIDECSGIIELSVTLDIVDAFETSLDVDLHSPSGETVRLYSNSGDTSTVFPDENEPYESLDPFLGTSGQGEWELEIINGASITDTEFAGWGLDMICLD